jgi:hypothetical protein
VVVHESIIMQRNLPTGARRCARAIRFPLSCFAAAALAMPLFAQSTQGPSSSRSPYLVTSNAGVVRNVTSITTATDLVPTTGALGTPFEIAGLQDGIGAYDNGDGTVTVLVCHEINTTNGAIRKHGARGTFISELIVDKQTLEVISAQDLIDRVVLADGTVRSVANGNPLAMGRFCSGDVPAVSAFYNAATGLGTQERFFVCGEEFANQGLLFATVATGADKGAAYALPAFNLNTASGVTGVWGSWENALASPFAQNLTIVAGTNDGGTGVMNNRVTVYVGTKTNTGNDVERAGLKNGINHFVSVVGNPVEIVSSTTRATNITSGTRFNLVPFSATADGTQFSRPEDGAWDPTNPRDFYFVTTDRLDTSTNTGENQTVGASGPANQRGMSRLWRLRFDDITNPTLGGEVTLVIDGSKNGQKVNMLDNMCVAADGMVYLTEDPGNSTYLGKTWAYDPATDTLVQLLKFDSQRWGELAVNGGTPGAVAPYTNDKEISGVIDVSDMFPHAADETVLLIDAQDHNSNAAVATPTSVEGGQLLLVRVALNAGTRAFGIRCGIPGLSLLANAGSRPVVGSTQTSTVANIPLGAPAAMLVGLSDQMIGGSPLPLSLAPIGLPGCFLYHDAAVSAGDPCVPTIPGRAEYSVVVPASHTVVGLKLYLQALSLQASANPAGIIGSNALELTVGL